MAYLWNPVPTPIFTSGGLFASGAQVVFYLGGTSTPITTYSDAGLTSPQPSPVIADANGVFPGVYLKYGTYRRRVTDQNSALISDLDNIDNVAPPTSGGGIAVTIDQVFQTGDPFWRMRSGIMAGFVRMNNKTIGSAVSAATEFANDSSSALFTFLWTTYDNIIAPVSGGRGASAAADFSANKTIGIPTMQGRIACGLDDMGATSAGAIQAITTCTTNGTATVTVVSAANITLGAKAVVNNLANGTVVSVTGTTVVLSMAAPNTGAGTPFRSSSFSTDAMTVAASAGGFAIALSQNELPSHAHAVTDPTHAHDYSLAQGGAILLNGAAFAFNSVTTASTTFSSTGVSINLTGGSNAFNSLSPMRLGTWYMHL